MKKSTQLTLQIIACFCLFIIDRVSKWYFFTSMTEQWRVNECLSFALHINHGVSFGMFKATSMMSFLLLSLAIGALILFFIGHTITRYRSNFQVMAELLVITGGVSNMLDRFIFGGVVDFILLSYNGWSWPVFNVADICIVAGIAILFLQSFKRAPQQ